MRSPSKRVLAVLGLAVLTTALWAHAQSQLLARTWTEPLTDVACTALDAGDGIDLSSAQGWRVTASANENANISGGSLGCCFRRITRAPVESSGTYELRWAPCDSALNYTLATGQRDSTSQDFTSTVGSGRLKYRTSAVTVALADGGAGDAGIFVDVTVEVRRTK